MASSLQYKPSNSKTLSLGEVDFDNSDDVVQFAKQRYQQRDAYRNALERQWYTNIAQYLGLQYHSYDDSTGNLVLPRAPPWRVRLVCNRLMPVVRKIVAKALKQRPIWTAIPASGDVRDQATSMIATKVLQYYWRYLSMDELLVELFSWTGTCGNCFMRVYWDPEKGSEVALSDEERMGLPDDLQKYAEGPIYLGEPQVEIATPFEIDPDPGASRFRDIRELIHSKANDMTALKDRYGNKAASLTAGMGEDSSMTRYFEKKIQGLTGVGVFGGTKRRDEDTNQILVHQLWMNPTKRWPNGKYCVVAGDELLENDDLPNPYHRIPYVSIQEIPVPGRIWGSCSMEQAIPLQADYNRGRSQVTEARNTMSKPKWMNAKNSGVIKTALTSEPGEVIEYIYPFKPEMVTPVPLPDYVLRCLDLSIRDIDDVTSIHEVTQARAPANVRAGVAIAQLQEQDDQTLAPFFLMSEKALSRIGSWLLSLVAYNVVEPRLVKLVGRDNEIDAFTFLGKDLIGGKQGMPGVNYFDVETQMGSQLPASRQARSQYVLDLVNMGILDRVNDRKKIFNLLDLGTEEPALKDEHLDRQNARRENEQLMAGIPLQPNPWDDDAVHIEEHRRKQKTPQFLQEANIQIVMNFEEHILLHYQGLQGMRQPPNPQQIQTAQMGLPPLSGTSDGVDYDEAGMGLDQMAGSLGMNQVQEAGMPMEGEMANASPQQPF